jgi:hypothetical protein
MAGMRASVLQEESEPQFPKLPTYRAAEVRRQEKSGATE